MKAKLLLSLLALLPGFSSGWSASISGNVTHSSLPQMVSLLKLPSMDASIDVLVGSNPGIPA